MCRWYRACDHPPWSWRPGVSSVRSATSWSRPPRSSSTRPCSRPTDRDDDAVPASEQRNERRDQKVVGDPRGVGNRGRQRQHAPDVVRPRGEHGQPRAPSRSNAPSKYCVEPLEVFLQPALDLVREIGARRTVRLRREVEERMYARRDRAARRRDARIEIDVEADCAALLGAESGELAQAVEVDRDCRHIRPFCLPGRILSLCRQPGPTPGTPRGSDSFSMVRAHTRRTRQGASSERRS